MELHMDFPDPFANVPHCLKCPVCIDVPKKRVFQCPSGHMVCEECHARISTCPQCRVPMGRQPIRNLIVEQMLDDLQLDCPYKGSGCTVKLDRRTAEEHIAHCSWGDDTRREAANVGLAAPESIVAGAAIAISTALPSINLTERSRTPESSSSSSPEAGDTDLHRAISGGEINLVRELLSQEGLDIDIRNDYLQTPLILAANLCSRLQDKDDHLQMVKLLIDKGADVFAKDDRNMTFLHNILGNFSFLEPPPPYTPLTPGQFHDLVEFLTDKNHKEVFDVKGWDDGGTPLQWAVQNLEVEERTLQLLQVYRVDFNAVSNYGQNVLEYARLGNRSQTLIENLRRFVAN